MNKNTSIKTARMITEIGADTDWNTKAGKQLVEAVLALKTADETKRFLRDLLTPAEIALLNAQPVLAGKFVACLDRVEELRPVADRVFVPLYKTPFDDDDLQLLFDSDWLWRDFTQEGAPLTRRVNRRRGFLLTIPLSALFCQLGELDWGIPDIGSLPEAKIARYHGYLAAVLEKARPETLGDVDTLAISESQVEALARQLKASPEDVEAAVLSLRDAVRIPVRKTLYIRARPEEVASRPG